MSLLPSGVGGCWLSFTFIRMECVQRRPRELEEDPHYSSHKSASIPSGVDGLTPVPQAKG